LQVKKKKKKVGSVSKQEQLTGTVVTQHVLETYGFNNGVAEGLALVEFVTIDSHLALILLETAGFAVDTQLNITMVEARPVLKSILMVVM
jgi:hypothetical protein